MKFAADRMLGRLAKWLRACGFDVYYNSEIDRSSLIKIAKDETRTILTRATNFSELKHVPPFFIIRSEFLKEQLAEFFSKYKNLRNPNNMFTRCMDCNTPLKNISKDKIAKKVPPKAYETNDKYKICPKCKKIYWSGTHVENMKKFFKNSTCAVMN